jgi:hypothetical protein
MAQAQADMNNVSLGMGRQYPEIRDWGIRIIRLFDTFVSPELRARLATTISHAQAVSTPQRILSGNNRLGVRRGQSFRAAGTGFLSSGMAIFAVADMLPYPYAPASTRRWRVRGLCRQCRLFPNSRCGRRGGGWEYKLR